MRVGLLEDEVAIQEMLLLMLKDEGYTVINFPGAPECLTALSNAVQQGTALPVDLMIVDWRLSGQRKLTVGKDTFRQVALFPYSCASLLANSAVLI